MATKKATRVPARIYKLAKKTETREQLAARLYGQQDDRDPRTPTRVAERLYDTTRVTEPVKTDPVTALSAQVRGALKRYTEAVVNDTWKGGGRPEMEAAIAAELEAATLHLHAVLGLAPPEVDARLRRLELVVSALAAKAGLAVPPL